MSKCGDKCFPLPLNGLISLPHIIEPSYLSLTSLVMDIKVIKFCVCDMSFDGTLKPMVQVND